jgi:acyl-CoA thioesterase FadM
MRSRRLALRFRDEQVATVEQSGVHLDLEARCSVPLPDASRSKARAMLAPTVGRFLSILVMCDGV